MNWVFISPPIWRKEQVRAVAKPEIRRILRYFLNSICNLFAGVNLQYSSRLINF